MEKYRRGNATAFKPGISKYDAQVFQRRFQANSLELCCKRRIISIDCTVDGGPDHDKSLRSHKVVHPDTLHGFVHNEYFEEILSPLKKVTTDSKTLLVFACRSGRLRAIADLTTALPAIIHNLYKGEASSVQTIHLPSGRFWRDLGPDNRQHCQSRSDYSSHVRNLAMYEATDVLTQRGAPVNVLAPVSPIDGEARYWDINERFAAKEKPERLSPEERLERHCVSHHAECAKHR